MWKITAFIQSWLLSTMPEYSSDERLMSSWDHLQSKVGRSQSVADTGGDQSGHAAIQSPSGSWRSAGEEFCARAVGHWAICSTCYTCATIKRVISRRVFTSPMVKTRWRIGR